MYMQNWGMQILTHAKTTKMDENVAKTIVKFMDSSIDSKTHNRIQILKSLIILCLDRN